MQRFKALVALRMDARSHAQGEQQGQRQSKQARVHGLVTTG